jgi:hypothetical protein
METPHPDEQRFRSRLDGRPFSCVIRRVANDAYTLLQVHVLGHGPCMGAPHTCSSLFNAQQAGATIALHAIRRDNKLEKGRRPARR